jgi:membrane fusion protein (multidrug efflux system)
LGEVYAINPLIDAAGRSIVMRARVPNPSGELKPGLFARVTLDLVVKDGAVFVPEEAIVPIGDNRFVFKVVDKLVDGKAAITAAFTPVKVGSRGRGMVEITEGLSAKDVVVTAGTLKIFDGAPVQPIPPAPPEGAQPAAEPATGKASAVEPATGKVPAAEPATGKVPAAEPATEPAADAKG